MTTADVVWAKVKYHSFWPAIIVNQPPEEVQKIGKPGLICVKFFGVKQDYGWVESCNIASYSDTKCHDKYKAKKRKGLPEAIAECDAFINKAKKGHVDSVVQQTPESVTVRTELPFNIKEEPDDDADFYAANTVKIAVKQDEQPNNRSVEETVTNTEMRVEASSAFRPQQMEQQLKAIAVEVHEIKNIVSNSSSSSKELVKKHESKICELEILLKDKSKENAKLESDVKDVASKNSSLLKESTEKFELKIDGLEKSLNAKSVECVKLVAANTKLESDVKDIGSKNSSLLKESADKFELKIRGLEESLKEKSIEFDKLVADNTKLKNDIKDIPSESSSSSKELTGTLELQISELQKSLSEKSAKFDELMADKMKMEKEIHENTSKCDLTWKKKLDECESKFREDMAALKQNLKQLKADNIKLQNEIKVASKCNPSSEKPPDSYELRYREVNKSSTKTNIQCDNLSVRIKKDMPLKTSPIKLIRSKKRLSFIEDSTAKPLSKKRKEAGKQCEVQILLGHKIKGGERWYLVRWKGFDESCDSWVIAKDLQCPDLMKQYNEKYNLV